VFFILGFSIGAAFFCLYLSCPVNITYIYELYR